MGRQQGKEVGLHSVLFETFLPRGKDGEPNVLHTKQRKERKGN